jgi:hypothetical protein
VPSEYRARLLDSLPKLGLVKEVDEPGRRKLASLTPAVSTIDLNQRYRDQYLGDMHSRRMKELRLDVKPALPGFEN